MRRISLTRTRLVAAATGALAALTLSASAASADVPDPLASGSHPTKKIDYEAGSMLLTLADGVSTTPVPLRGSITYADDVDFARIVVFVHGRHGVCIGTPTAPRQICDDTTAPDGTPLETDIRSYAGYDYMAKNLASHGYTVMSVEANTSNFDNNWRDGGANARSQIIQANLELLFRWNNGAGPYVPGEPDHTVGTKLTGRLDFADGIGIMGHSRGGDAVTDYIGYTRNLRVRSGFQRIVLDAVLALAPVNYTANKMPYGTNYAVLLPACDGDVSTLQGARFFENSKYPTGSADTFAKVQWYVQGTDHNFFNTVWTGDDFSRTDDPACSRTAPKTARLTPGDQRRVGAALMNSFMRRYVGGERAFDPIMTGQVTLPESAAPLASGKGVAEEVKTSYVAPAAARFDLLKPTPIADPQPDPALGGPVLLPDTRLVSETASGGPITARGLTTFQVCNPNDLAYRQGPTYPTPYPLCPEGALNRSKGNQFTVAWDGPASLTAYLGRAGAPRDVSGFGVLDLRAAVNRNDPRNPAGDNTTPNSATQNFDVTLIDAAGRRATTKAARWTTSLEPSIGTTYQHIVLNGIRIPLNTFTGVDLRQITAVELGFTAPSLGSIQLADVMFQETPQTAGGIPTAAVRDVDPVYPGPDGPPSTPPGPIIDPPPVAVTADAACVDASKPSVKLAKFASTGKKLVVTGVASDAGCAGGRGIAAGGVQRTLVSVYRLTGKGKARFLNAKGTLSKALPLDGGIAISAKGTSSWSVSVPTAKLPKGTYRLSISTFDRAGNLKKLPVRFVKVK